MPQKESKFVTPDLIEGTSIVGSPSEIEKKIRVTNKMDLCEVNLLPPLKHLRETTKDFSEQVIPLI